MQSYMLLEHLTAIKQPSDLMEICLLFVPVSIDFACEDFFVLVEQRGTSIITKANPQTKQQSTSLSIHNQGISAFSSSSFLVLSSLGGIAAYNYSNETQLVAS